MISLIDPTLTIEKLKTMPESQHYDRKSSRLSERELARHISALANGGAIGGSTIATLSLLQAEDNTFTMQGSTQPVRSGYAFAGWNTAEDGSGKSYTAGQTYMAAEDAEIQLFAQWEEVGVLSGNFNQGGNTLAIAIPDILTKDANVMVVCYNEQGQMLDMAFGTREETMWIFEIGRMEDAHTWSVFFTDDDTHAPKQVNLPLNISK